MSDYMFAAGSYARRSTTSALTIEQRLMSVGSKDENLCVTLVWLLIKMRTQTLVSSK